MRKRKLTTVLTLVCILIAACTQPGTPIDDGRYESGLYYIDMNDRESYIARAEMNGNLKSVVPPRVLAYAVEGHFLVAARQPLRGWLCGDNGVRSELLNSIEYWWVDLESGSIGGPLSFYEVVRRFSPEASAHFLDQIAPKKLRPKLLQADLVNCPEPRERVL